MPLFKMCSLAVVGGAVDKDQILIAYIIFEGAKSAMSSFLSQC